jgi:hypothetical protein
MRFRLITAIIGVLFVVPMGVSAQRSDSQATDRDSQVAPGVQASEPEESAGQQSPEQVSTNQESTAESAPTASSLNLNSGNPGQNPGETSGSSQESYSTPAPEETNGVARISQIHGDVSTQRGESGSWSAAALNAPVLAGDRISTGDQARTEIQIDYANVLRLAEHTQANLATLTRSQIQIQLGHGMANYSGLKDSDAEAEIDTPNVAIRTNRRESSFRIVVSADNHTEVLVRKGEVEVTTPQGGTRVRQGQLITVQGSGEEAQYKVSEAPDRDSWDQWNTERDGMIRNADSRRRTNDYYVGVEDLDAYGTWTDVPDYGPVWRPAVHVGWAPYRAGRWVYEPYWGWTWVSYDPWGWAPYHYGRWMYYDSAWVWWPGPVYGYPFYRPIWAPAYVSFFGFGRGFGFGFGFGFGSIGWIPLGPCDHFHPWWGRWGGHHRFVGFNAFNRGGFAPLHHGNRFSNVRLAMHDAHFRGGTTVSASQFGRGHMGVQPMTHAAFRNANFATGRLPVNPGRESFSASGRSAAAATIPNRSQNQHFFSARSSTAGASRGFDRGPSQGSNFNSQGGRPAGSGREVSSNGFQRFSQAPGMRSGSNGGSTPRSGYSGGTMSTHPGGGSNGGWQRFSRSSSMSNRSGESRGSYGAYSGGRSSGNYGGRSTGSYEGRSYGGAASGGGRSYGGGGYSGRSTPSYGGGRSYGGGASSGGRSGGSYSSHSGGSYHGGGASHSSSGGGRHGR